MSLCSRIALATLSVSLALPALGQASAPSAPANAPAASSATQTPGKGGAAAGQTAVELAPRLLPLTFGSYKSTGDTAASTPEPAFSLVNADKAALEECGPQQSLVENYTGGGKFLHVEAVQFKDASGALAAFSMLAQPGMHELKDLGTRAADGQGGVLFVQGTAAVVVFPAAAADASTLKAMADLMPKPVGSAALLPLLPSLLPTRGLQPASVRYAVGEQGYMADGGALPAAGLGWQQSAEAVTAKYNDRRGAETLTLLLYPTPTIAGAHSRNVEAQISGLGPSFAKTKTRREGSLLIVANGTFSPDAAQALVESTHLRQYVSTDKAMPTPEVIETRQTFGTLANTIILSGLLCAAALFIGLFLGGGRALIRIMQGKPAATEAEFLSLHLDPQNPVPQYTPGKPGNLA